jgi:cytidylate kinase
MAIITISRGSASGGRLLAEGLAKTLGFHIVSREEIIEIAARFGVPEAKLDKALLDPPTFSEEFKQDRRRYLIFIQNALCEWAQKDDVIYHGNAGHLLLRGISHMLRIRLIAPLQFRVQKIVELTKMTSAQAVSYIEKIDAQRRAWNLLLYGVDWLSPTLYDLTINLETMTVDTAVEIAAAAIRRPEFSRSAESQKKMNDLAMTTRIKAGLAADPATESADLELEADSESGIITLTDASVLSQDVLDIVLERIQGIPGVTSVIQADQNKTAALE